MFEETRKKMIAEYQNRMDISQKETTWAVHKRFEQNRLVQCSIPYIGKEYFNQEKRILVYASAEVLTDYYPGNSGCMREWLDDDNIAIDRHRWFFDNTQTQIDLSEENGTRFFPDVHIEPMNDGALPVAMAYILSKLGIEIECNPHNMYERIAIGNYGKFTIESEFQNKIRTTGKIDKDADMKNIDYAGDINFLKDSHDYIEIDIKNLQPDIIIMPQSIYQTDEEFITKFKKDAIIISFMQMNTGNVNRHIKEKYEIVSQNEISSIVNNWYGKMKENGWTGCSKDNYIYVFGYLKNRLEEIGKVDIRVRQLLEQTENDGNVPVDENIQTES